MGKCIHKKPESGLAGKLHEGVYTMLGGPNFETVAELKMLRVCGVDAVGMSTIPEVLVARHCGINVFAFSLITNECILEEDTNLAANHEEVMEAANMRQNQLRAFVGHVIEGIHESKTHGLNGTHAVNVIDRTYGEHHETSENGTR